MQIAKFFPGLNLYSMFAELIIRLTVVGHVRYLTGGPWTPNGSMERVPEVIGLHKSEVMCIK
jgi:hypothetical protein